MDPDTFNTILEAQGLRRRFERIREEFTKQRELCRVQRETIQRERAQRDPPRPGARVPT
jgi:hypothetical protein